MLVGQREADEPVTSGSGKRSRENTTNDSLQTVEKGEAREARREDHTVINGRLEERKNEVVARKEMRERERVKWMRKTPSMVMMMRDDVSELPSCSTPHSSLTSPRLQKTRET